MLILLPVALALMQTIPPDGLSSSRNHGTRDDVRVVLNKVHTTLKCDRNSVYVLGDSGDLTITGVCVSLVVEGSHNVITIAQVTQIDDTGKHNIIHYFTPAVKIRSRGKDSVIAPAGAASAPPPQPAAPSTSR